MPKQRHAGVELELIREAEDLRGAAAGHLIHQLRALAQPRAQERVRQVSARLGQRAERVPARGCASAEPRQLREDEPHPVRALLAGAKLGAHPRIHRGLRCHEAFEGS
jgi:hypothetical protein